GASGGASTGVSGSARRACPPALPPASCRDRLLRLDLCVGLQDQVANLVLRGGIDDRPQQGEASALSVHRILTGRERDVAAVAAAAFPDREANQLQSLERPFAKVQLGVGQLSRWTALVVQRDLDEHGVAPPGGAQSARALREAGGSRVVPRRARRSAAVAK